MRDLLSHRTGIATASTDHIGSHLTRRTFLDNIATLPTDTRFRESFRYSSDMYSLAGAILEHVSGERFEDLVRAKVLEPNAIEARYMTDDDLLADDIALGHYGVPDGTNRSFTLRPVAFDVFRRMIGTEGVQSPAEGLMASADDMCEEISPCSTF